MLAETLQKKLTTEDWQMIPVMLEKIPFLREGIQECLQIIAERLQMLDANSETFVDEFKGLQKEREILQDFLQLYVLAVENKVVKLGTF